MVLQTVLVLMLCAHRARPAHSDAYEFTRPRMSTHASPLSGSDVFKALLKKIIVGEEGKKKLDDKIVDAATAAAASVVSYVAAFLFWLCRASLCRLC